MTISILLRMNDSLQTGLYVQNIEMHSREYNILGDLLRAVRMLEDPSPAQIECALHLFRLLLENGARWVLCTGQSLTQMLIGEEQAYTAQGEESKIRFVERLREILRQ